MNNLFKQLGALLAMGLQTLPQRKGSSSVVMIGIAGVVAVLISLLAIAAGLELTLQGGGRADTAVLLSNGAESESDSVLAQSEFDTVGSLQNVAHDAAGKPLVSAEIVTLFPAKFRGSGEEGNVSLRGIGSQGLAIHSGIHIIDGRAFQPGLREMLVGTGVAQRFQGFATGDQVLVGNTAWTVTGHFQSDDVHASEVLVDVDTAQTTLNMGGYYNAFYVRLKSADEFRSLKNAITQNPTLHIDVKSEPDYLAMQSKGMTDVLVTTAYVIGIIMAIGALFGAIHSLYISADARKVEMATLRAIGFGAASVMTAFLIEAMALALAGGAIGAVLAWLLFDGHTASTASGGLSQVIFQLHVSTSLMATGLLWACAIGLLGALVPGLRAARRPLVEALRR